ncbi:hypothetical protein SAMN04487939_10845 [Lysobacter sp. yr284]|uniref:hypothetical protein n=1 Tax=Lysobacter sp. yr284 TaxID=1761791 RepID=UPI000899C2EA|nr:hypothetical protein [Lysobacter sp. yr284]SDY89911.1 hypothetical protein SAMN04487939_10845 [Lysobacter sp. yr284]
MIAILTLPVLLYQLLFVLVMYLASRVSARAMLVALILCLLWTATHLFFLPLALVQSAVIGISYWWFMKKRKLREARAASD